MLYRGLAQQADDSDVRNTDSEIVD
uniref:Uncharacterized protein n=1 Tax=Anguilla anguilla TaxID=7936 RepID=A0A0E9Q9M4_ANGAN